MFDGSFGGDVITDFGDGDAVVLTGLSSSEVTKVETELTAGEAINLNGSTTYVHLDGVSLTTLDSSVKTQWNDGTTDYTLHASGVGALSGSSGDDIMTGGSGIDSFVFENNGGSDTIKDFEAGEVLVFTDADNEADLIISDRSGVVTITAGNTVVTLEGLTDASILNSYVDDEDGLAKVIWGDIPESARKNEERIIDDQGETDVPEVINLTDALSAAAASQSTTWVSGSSEGAHEAHRAIDGDFDTESHTDHNDANQWLEIDLGHDAAISQIDVYNRFLDSSYGPMRFNNLLQDAVVTVLDDGAEVWTSEGMTNAVLHTFDLDGIVGDTVRIEGARNYLHVSEVDVFGIYEPEIINLTDTLSADAASQSSNWSDTSWVAAWAIDNDDTTNTHTASSDAAPWFELDLGGDAALDEATIVNNHVSSRLNGASLVVYDDDQIVWSQELTGDANQTIQFVDDLGNGVVGDRVRIDHEDGQYVHIHEIDLYGYFV